MQPLHILNEAEQAASHSTPVELMQSPDTSETQLNSESFTVEVAIAKCQATYPELFFLEKEYNKEDLLQVMPKKMHHVSSCGNISVVRILFNPVELCGFTYSFQVLFSSVETENVTNLDEFISVCSKLSNGAQYKFCPGLNIEHFKIHTFILSTIIALVCECGKVLQPN